MLFVRSGYPLPHILIVQSLQESIKRATYLLQPALFFLNEKFWAGVDELERRQQKFEPYTNGYNHD